MAAKPDYAAIHREAHSAGMAAGKAAIPTPMTVYEADGLSNRPKPGGKSWYVSEGVCGFAWVTIPDGRSSFARWAAKQKLGHKGYPKGFDLWVHQFGQSMTRKEAYARAYAKVLRDNGIDAYPRSRMD